MGFFGQLTDKKGLRDAIQVLAILRCQYSIDAKLDIFGSVANPAKLDEIIDKYSKIAQDYQVYDFIKFHGYTNQVYIEMMKCHCVLFPSYSEAQPLTIIEALTVGVPVVAYDCKYGSAAMIENGRSGYLVEVGNVQDMTSNVCNILQNVELHATMSKHAKQSAIKLANSDVLYQKWLNVFNNVKQKRISYKQ